MEILTRKKSLLNNFLTLYKPDHFKDTASSFLGTLFNFFRVYFREYYIGVQYK